MEKKKRDLLSVLMNKAFLCLLEIGDEKEFEKYLQLFIEESK